jgi:hypothetical protein
MEDVTLSSVGARFKKWGCYTPILPKCQVVPHITRKIKIKDKKIGEMEGGGSNPQSIRL